MLLSLQFHAGLRLLRAQPFGLRVLDYARLLVLGFLASLASLGTCSHFALMLADVKCGLLGCSSQFAQ